MADDSDGALRVFTIGHSNHPAERLVELLGEHHIDVVADVRSAPYSRYTPQFNRPALARLLPAHDVEYEFLGDSLGGRPDDPECYDPAGHVVYDLLEATSEYRQGVDVVLRKAEFGNRICLMCSEEDPTVCHRALSVGHFLHERGVIVQHIRGDGRIEEQSALQGKAINKPQQFSLFEELPQRKSLLPVSRERPPSSSLES